MQRRLTTQDVTWFLDLHGMNRLDLDPSYQRKSVWTRRDRQFFLDTIFNNYPSPAIFLHKELDESGNPTYHVVDGKQRLETILLFVSNKLPIRNDIGDDRLSNKRWRELANETELKHRLWDYQLTVEMLDSIELTVVNEVFGRLNQNSRKLTPQEIRHSRYDGWLVSFAEAEVERPLWRALRISTTARARRMQDVQFVSELIAVTMRREVIGFDQDWLNEFYARYEEPEATDPDFDREEFVNRFESIASFVQSVDDHTSVVSRHASTFANLYSLWAWLSRCEELPDEERFAEIYGRFMESVDSSMESDDDQSLSARYARNARGASTDLRPRAERDAVLHEVLSSLG